MNAESEMAGADGLGAVPTKPDPLDELAADCGYNDNPDEAKGEDDGGVDALIDYKNALEDRCHRIEEESDRAEAALTQCQHIAYDGTVPYTAEQIKANKHLWMLDRVREIAEGGKADPEFVAMLAAARDEDGFVPCGRCNKPGCDPSLERRPGEGVICDECRDSEEDR